MIWLVDSSLLIEGFKDRGRLSARQRVAELIAVNGLAFWELIAGELLLGARTQREFTDIEYYLLGLRELPAPPDVWRRAARLGFDLRRKGVTVPLIDLSVAVVAMYHEVPLVSMDKHFELIAEVCDLDHEYVSPTDAD